MLFILTRIALVLVAADDSAAATEGCAACEMIHEESDDMDEVFDVSLLQTSLSLVTSKKLREHEAATHSSRSDTGELRQERSNETNVSKLQPTKGRMNQSDDVFDDVYLMEQTHACLLVVICCMGFAVMIAAHYHTTTKASNPLVDCLTNMPGCDQTSCHVALGTSACLKVQLEYSHNPDDCSHEEGLRSYKARNNVFQICDQCGSRWLFQKDKGAYTPIAPRVHPADPE